MTAHPIDTEALARRAGHILFTEGPEQPAATARETCVLLDLLAAAEHRATRAEAERDASRKQYDEDIAYWIAATDAAEARIKAVEDVLDNIDTPNDPALHDGFADILHALEG